MEAAALEAPGSRTTGAPAAEALGEVFERFSEAVFRAAYRITGDPADAEDVLQTVFLRLARREAELDPSGNAPGYLHRAAVNAALDLLRRRRRLRAVPLEEVAGVLPDGAPRGPEGRSEDRELREGLRRALLSLPPRSAEIFALRYFEDLTNQEIARLLGLSQASVGVTLHRARGRLKKALRPLAGGPS